MASLLSSFGILGHRGHVPILVYHRICEAPSISPLAVPPAQFEQQMAFLSSEGYHSISLEELVAMHRRGLRPARRCFVLTFDDGYRDNYLIAFPILRRFGFQATIFLVSDWLLRNGHGMSAPILQLEDITEMNGHGIAFGAHTRSHRSLTALSSREAEAEIRGCKEALESHLGQSIKFFSYPYGHSDAYIRSMVKACGFEGACAVNNGSDDPFNLRRIEIRADDSLLDFRFKVCGWDGWALLALKWLERRFPLREA